MRDMPSAAALQLISSFAPTVSDHLRRGCPMGSVALMHQFVHNAHELRVRWPGKECSDQWIFSTSVAAEMLQARGACKLDFGELADCEEDVVPLRPLARAEVVHGAPADNAAIADNNGAQRRKLERKFLEAIGRAPEQDAIIASLHESQVRQGLRPSSHEDVFGRASCASAAAASCAAGCAPATAHRAAS